MPNARLVQTSAVAASVLALGAAAVGAKTATTSSHHAMKPPAHTKPPPSPPKLTATVSSASRVSLKNSRGANVTSLKAGWYTVLVEVRTRTANFHIVGPGTNKWTTKKFLGDVLWGVHFVKGSYRYMNDTRAKATTHRVSVS